MRDTLQVAAFGGASITLTLTNINLILSITVAVLSISFTLYKWFKIHKGN